MCNSAYFWLDKFFDNIRLESNREKSATIRSGWECREELIQAEINTVTDLMGRKNQLKLTALKTFILLSFGNMTAG